MKYYTANITGLGVLRLLECFRIHAPKAKFYQASSSEMFGNASNNVQNENTIFKPQSPYAVSKIFGHNKLEIIERLYLFCFQDLI